jgi:N4-gp56 family major capsid protein
MAVQSIATGNALTVKQWSVGLEAETLKKLSYRAFIGKRSDSLIQEKDELSKEPGDQITIGLRGQLDPTLAPVQGNAGLEGNERTIDLYTDAIKLDQIRDAVRFNNVIDKQRVTFDMRDEAKVALADKLAAVMDFAFFHHIAGNTAVDDTALTFNNATVAATDVIRPTASTDEGLGSSNTFTLELVDWAVEKAKTRSFMPMRPAHVEGLGEYYICFLHPYQVRALRASGSQWTAIQRDILQGMKDPNGSPLITGGLGVYNGVLFVESSRVPLGVNSSTDAAVSNTRRAVLAGAQAAAICYGRFGGSDERFRWVEKEFDYDNQLGVAAGLVGGMKKLQFNSTDVSSIVISTYAASAT